MINKRTLFTGIIPIIVAGCTSAKGVVIKTETFSDIKYKYSENFINLVSFLRNNKFSKDMNEMKYNFDILVKNSGMEYICLESIPRKNCYIKYENKYIRILENVIEISENFSSKEKEFSKYSSYSNISDAIKEIYYR